MTSIPSADQLKRAIQISEQIAELEAELVAVFNGSAPAQRSAAPTGGRVAKSGRKRRTMSAEAREKIAAAQRARWAKTKGKSSAASAATPKSAKAGKKTKKSGGGITAAGRAKLAAMMKARWAARKKGAPAPNAKR